MADITWKADILERWNLFISPARPDSFEIETYGSTLSKIDETNPSVLILGSTPELRDYFLNRSIVPTCCDYSEAHFRALKDLCTNKTPEKFIQSNWLEIPTDQQYDIIVGDHVVNMFKKEQISSFFSRLSALTKKNGLVALRTIIRLDEKYLYQPSGIIQHYRQFGAKYNFYTGTHYPFLHPAYHVQEDYVSVAEAYQKVELTFKAGLINEKELNEWRMRGEGITLEMYLPSLTKLKEYFQQSNFVVENVWFGKEPYSKFVPMTFARKL